MKSLLQMKSLAQRTAKRGPRESAPLVALLLLVCAAHARAQLAVEPATPQAPAATSTPRPAKPSTQQRAPVARPATTAGRPSTSVRPAAAPVGVQAVPPARPAPAAAIAPMRPRQVVMVVHRMSGWKLLAWLATSGPPSLELEELPSPSDVHTNIVAGYISDDGRTVVARLPSADAAVETAAAPTSPVFAAMAPPAPPGEPEFTLLTADGRRVEAKFVGLDATTGLSLLEASSSLMTNEPVGTEGSTDDPTVGQRVLFYGPAPAAPATPVAAAPPSSYIIVNIGQREGRLTEVKSGPSGKLFRLVARTPDASPEWTGAVVANELGEVLGIVSRTDSGATQIVPVTTVRGALERVKTLRASAPQPWLGVNGAAAFRAPLQTWESFGWKPETALPHIQGGRGVFLTSVPPGTPAALAGLRAGDLISRVGPREVRGAEDLSLTLEEAGVGSTVDFTVLRALEPAPLKFSVRLAGVQDAALANLQAEARAAAVTNSNDPTPEARAFGAANSLRVFGLDGLRLSRRGAARLGAKGGLLVVAVRPGSYAAASGLRAGDIVETANGADFTLPSLLRLLSNRASAPLSLGLVRDGTRTSVLLKTSSVSEP
jgi:S1-C subfamily serine protease